MSTRWRRRGRPARLHGFESVAKLDDGDRVVIDGTFVRDQGSCVKETSTFAKNGMLTPDFLFLFSSIHPA